MEIENFMRLKEASQDFDLRFDDFQNVVSCFGCSTGFFFFPKPATSADGVIIMLFYELGRYSAKFLLLFLSSADSDMDLVNIMNCVTPWPSCAVPTASSQDADLGKRVGLHGD